MVCRFSGQTTGKINIEVSIDGELDKNKLLSYLVYGPVSCSKKQGVGQLDEKRQMGVVAVTIFTAQLP